MYAIRSGNVDNLPTIIQLFILGIVNETYIRVNIQAHKSVYYLQFIHIQKGALGCFLQCATIYSNYSLRIYSVSAVTTTVYVSIAPFSITMVYRTGEEKSIASLADGEMLTP